VVLHFGHGVGYPELADAFALREGTVRMRISRALSRMRAALAPDRLAEAAESADFELESPTLSRPVRAEGIARAGWRGPSTVSARTLGELEGDDEVSTAARAPAGLDLDEWDAALASAPPMPTSTGDLDELTQTTVRGLFGADLDDAPDAAASPTGSPYAPHAGAAAAPSAPSPTFGSLRDEVPPALRERLDALAASL
jgi:hypothetical protein